MTETLPRDHLVTSIDQLERLYGEPYGPSIAKVADRVTTQYRAFIEAAPFFALASGGPDGMDCSPRGDAPGFGFETLEWIKRTELAGLASDTWGCEVRPNETEPGINQPWHWITIPMMGMTMGEIFYVKELAEDCAADKVYEFLFVAPALPITGAVGSPVNPLAIK